MRMTLLRVAALAALAYAGLAQAEERIEGTVVDAKATYCGAGKREGCTGRLTLRREYGGRPETLTIQVPLGTPVSRGCDAVRLRRLVGQTVIVTEACMTNAHVAKAIESAESAESAC